MQRCVRLHHRVWPFRNLLKRAAAQQSMDGHGTSNTASSIRTRLKCGSVTARAAIPDSPEGSDQLGFAVTIAHTGQVVSVLSVPGSTARPEEAEHGTESGKTAMGKALIDGHLSTTRYCPTVADPNHDSFA